MTKQWPLRVRIYTARQYWFHFQKPALKRKIRRWCKLLGVPLQD